MNRMLLTISGLSGSGKSSTAKELSKKLGVPTVDIGEIFRAMAKKYGMDVVEFGKYAEEHPEIDRKLDAAMVRRAKRGELILQGRLAGWMAVLHDLPAIKIWIGASPRVRAERVAKRQHVPFREAAAEIKKRDQDNRVRYLQTYGLDLNDLSLYDITVQTDGRSVEQVVASLVNTLSLWLKKRKIQTERHSKPRRRVKKSPPKKRPLQKQKRKKSSSRR